MENEHERFALYTTIYKCKKLFKNSYVAKSFVRFEVSKVLHYNRNIV